MQLNQALTDWLKAKEKEALSRLLSEDNGKVLAEAGYTLRVKITASRDKKTTALPDEMTPRDWARVKKAFVNQPEQLRFLELLERLGNAPTRFNTLHDLSNGWLDWNNYLYLNSMLRKRDLRFRLAFPKEQRRLPWQDREYRLYHTTS